MSDTASASSSSEVLVTVAAARVAGIAAAVASLDALLPKDVTLHLMQRYIDASSLLRLGRCSLYYLKLSHRCELHNKSYPLGVLIRERWEGSTTIYASLTPHELPRIEQEYGRSKKQIRSRVYVPFKWIHHKREHQIGYITEVTIPVTYRKKPMQLLMHKLALLPSCIKSLEASSMLDLPVGRWCTIPASITRLTLGGKFNMPLADRVFLPKGLRELRFDGNEIFNQEMFQFIQLPPTLTVLHVGGSKFNQPIDHLVLPTGLIELVLGLRDFNRSVANLKLPEGLRSLTFASGFNHSSFAQLYLPSSLTSITLGDMFNQQCMNEWIPPYSLTKLTISSKVRLRGDLDPLNLVDSMLTYELPDGGSRPTDFISSLNFASYLNHIAFSQQSKDLNSVRLPDSITSIQTGLFFNRPLTMWTPPKSLKDLTLSWGWQPQSLNSDWLILPPNHHSSLTRLEFGSGISRYDEFTWPISLICLRLLNHKLDIPYKNLPRNLPPSLERLELGAQGVWLRITIPRGCVMYGIQYKRSLAALVPVLVRVSKEKIDREVEAENARLAKLDAFDRATLAGHN